MNRQADNTINDRLKDIFMRRFGVDFTRFSNEYLDKELLGNEIKMQPRDLVYLFFDIQNEFGINIPQTFISEGNFSTYNNIKNMIVDIK